MLIYFGFTYCPDVCPITLLTMANVLDKLENEKITPLFITVDPERDNETILSNYVSAFHDDIIGLTGSIDEINKVTSDWKVYFKKENNIDMPDNYTVNHLDIIFIANKNNKFLSLKFILNLIFLTNNKVKIINGINIPICFPKNNNGNLM